MRWPDQTPRLWPLAALVLAGCAGDARADLALPPATFLMEIVSGSRQHGTVGRELPRPVVVQVLDAQGRPVKGQLVRFRVVTGGGSMYAGSSITDRDGLAEDYWTMGRLPGLATLQVRLVDPTNGRRRSFAVARAVALGPLREASIFPGSASVDGSAPAGAQDASPASR